MNSDTSWYAAGKASFSKQPALSGEQSGRPPDVEMKEKKPDIKKLIEDVCLVDDEDDAEEAINYFRDMTRKKILLPLTGVEIQEEFKFLEAIKQFKMILEKKIEVLTLRKNLKEILYKYLSFFGSNYGRIAILYKEQYWEVMEDILVVYCDVVMEFFRDQIRMDKKPKVEQEARRIKILLRDCLLKKMDRILHVLLKVKLDPQMDQCTRLWSDVYLYFLTKVPCTLTNDDILRSFIAFQKFKTIRKQQESSMIDQLMLKVYKKKSLDELREVPCLAEILDKRKRDRFYTVRDMLSRYISYFKEKKSKECFEIELLCDEDEATITKNFAKTRRFDFSLDSSSDTPSTSYDVAGRRGKRKNVLELDDDSDVLSALDRYDNEFSVLNGDVIKREDQSASPVVVLDDEDDDDDDVILVSDNLRTVITIDDDDDDDPPLGDALSPDKLIRPPEPASTPVEDTPAASTPMEITRFTLQQIGGLKAETTLKPVETTSSSKVEPIIKEAEPMSSDNTLEAPKSIQNLEDLSKNSVESEVPPSQSEKPFPQESKQNQTSSAPFTLMETSQEPMKTRDQDMDQSNDSDSCGDNVDNCSMDIDFEISDIAINSTMNKEPDDSIVKDKEDNNNLFNKLNSSPKPVGVLPSSKIPANLDESSSIKTGQVSKMPEQQPSTAVEKNTSKEEQKQEESGPKVVEKTSDDADDETDTIERPKTPKNTAEDFRDDLSQSVTSARKVTPQEVDKMAQLPFKYSQPLWKENSDQKTSETTTTKVLEVSPQQQQEKQLSMPKTQQQGKRRMSEEALSPVRPFKIYSKDPRSGAKDLSQPKDRDMSLKSYKSLIKGTQARSSVLLENTVPKPPGEDSLLFDNAIEDVPIEKPKRNNLDNFLWSSDNEEAKTEDETGFNGVINVKPDSQLYKAQDALKSPVGAGSRAQEQKGVTGGTAAVKRKVKFSSAQPQVKEIPAVDKKGPASKWTGQIDKLLLESSNGVSSDSDDDDDYYRRRIQAMRYQEMKEKQKQSLQRAQICGQIFSEKFEPKKTRSASANSKVSSKVKHPHFSPKGKDSGTVHVYHKNGQRANEKRKNRNETSEQNPRKKIAVRTDLMEKKAKISPPNGKIITPKSILKPVKEKAPSAPKLVAATERNGIDVPKAPSSPVKVTKSGRVCKRPRLLAYYDPPETRSRGKAGGNKL